MQTSLPKGKGEDGEMYSDDDESDDDDDKQTVSRNWKPALFSIPTFSSLYLSFTQRERERD